MATRQQQQQQQQHTQQQLTQQQHAQQQRAQQQQQHRQELQQHCHITLNVQSCSLMNFLARNLAKNRLMDTCCMRVVWTSVCVCVWLCVCLWVYCSYEYFYEHTPTHTPRTTRTPNQTNRKCNTVGNWSDQRSWNNILPEQSQREWEEGGRRKEGCMGLGCVGCHVNALAKVALGLGLADWKATSCWAACECKTNPAALWLTL